MINLRVYAVSLGNKFLVVYFATLAVSRLVMGILTAYITSPTVVTNIQFKLTPNDIGTAFGM